MESKRNNNTDDNTGADVFNASVDRVYLTGIDSDDIELYELMLMHGIYIEEDW